QVLPRAARAPQRHPARQPALERQRLVLREVDAEGVADDRQDPAHGLGLLARWRRFLGDAADCQVGMSTQSYQLFGKRRKWQRRVHDARVDRATRHLAELRRLGLLRERDTVLRL